MLCPRCDYDLTGLPERHICPECGCEYDEHSMGIPLTARRYLFWNTAVVLSWMAVFVGFRSRRGFDPWEFFFVLCWPVLFVAAMFWRFQRRAGLPTRLVIDRVGVELVTPGQEPLRWAWSEIQRAEVGWAMGRFYLLAHDESFLITRGYPSLGGLKIAKLCAAEINSRIELYKSAPTNPSEPGNLRA